MNKNKNYTVEDIRLKFTSLFERISLEIKKEKSKSSKLRDELNSLVIDKNKLEKIFINCIEDARKEIYFRKTRDAMRYI